MITAHYDMVHMKDDDADPFGMVTGGKRGLSMVSAMSIARTCGKFCAPCSSPLNRSSVPAAVQKEEKVKGGHVKPQIPLSTGSTKAVESLSDILGPLGYHLVTGFDTGLSTRHTTFLKCRHGGRLAWGGGACLGACRPWTRRSQRTTGRWP